MKMYLGLFLAFLSFNTNAVESTFKPNTSTSASLTNITDYEKLGTASSGVNEQTSPRVSWGDADRLKSSTRNNLSFYKDRNGQVLITGFKPSGNFDKFTKKTKVVYKDIEGEWERQLNKKPAARIGMSHKQILRDTNWGNPKDVRTSIDASGTSEQWMYSNTHSLYFKNGKLIKIEK